MAILPVKRDTSAAEFLDGAARGEFLIRRSRTTGELLGPQIVIDSAGSTDLEWVPASGRGTVVSWTVSYRKPVDGEQRPDSVLAIIELAEGPWWWCELLDADPERMRAGLPVEVAFVRPDGSAETVPVFRVVA
jgi:uncharacterized OB-fold protein